MEVFRLMGSILINRGEVTGDLKGIEREARTLGDRMGATFQKIGDRMHKALKVGAVAAGAAIVGFGVAGIKAFADFDAGMRRVFTLLPGLDSRIRDDLTEGVKELSKELGILPQDIVPALYAAISARVPPENVLDFLRDAGKAAIGGVGDLTTSVNGLATIVNAYGAETMTAARASDILFTAARYGRTTVDELFGSLHAIIPVASEVGLSFEQLVSWVTQMTAQGLPAATAVGSIQAVLVALGREGGPVAELFEKLAGTTFPQFIARGNTVADAFELMSRYADENKTSLLGMGLRAEAVQAVLAVTGRHADTFRGRLAELGKSAGATEAAFREMEEGLADAFEDLRAWWGWTLVEIGEELQAPFQQFVDWLEENKERIAEMAVGLFRDIANALQWFIDNGRTVAWSIGLISAALLGLWIATHPIAAAVVGIAAGLGILIGQALAAQESVKRVADAFREIDDLAATLDGTLRDLGERYEVNTGTINLLSGSLLALRDEMDEFVRQGGSVEEALVRWRAGVREVMEGFAAAYPKMADFAAEFLAEFEGMVDRELALRKQQAEAIQAVTQATEEHAVVARDAQERAIVGLEEYAEHLRRTAKEIQTQEDLYYKLQGAAMRHAESLRGLTVGSAAWHKEMAAANKTMRALEILFVSLYPENVRFADGVKDAMFALRGLGATGLTSAEGLAILRGEYQRIVELTIGSLIPGTKQYKDALEPIPALYKAVQYAIEGLRAAGEEVPAELELMARRLADLNAEALMLPQYVTRAGTALEKLIEYVVAWAKWGKKGAEEFGFSWETMLGLIGNATRDLASGFGDLFATVIDVFADNERAAQEYAESIERIAEDHKQALLDIDRRYEEARLSASERFIRQVQREGATVQEREAMIADAVARGLLTQEEANAARARMTDEVIAYERSAIYELEQAVKKAERDKLDAIKAAGDEKVRLEQEAARKRADAERNVVRTILKGVADTLKAMAMQATAMAAAEGVMSGILFAASAVAALLLHFTLAAALLAEAQAATARAGAYALKAAALWAAAAGIGALAGLAEGGLVQRPTLAVVGEGQHEEAVLPLTETVFRRLGAGIVAAMGHVRYPDMAVWPEYRPEDRVVETVNFERMFDGATINVRDRGDVEDLAVEIHRLFVDRQRGVGVVGVIR